MWDLSIIVLGMNRQAALFIEGITFCRMIMNVCCEDAGMNREL